MDTTADQRNSLMLETELRRELTAGEHVLWQGMPDPAKMRMVFVIWLFAIPWTVFSLGWTGIALSVALQSLTTDQGIGWWSWIFPLWGTPFIAVGLWMMRWPLMILADAKNTIHALTNQRLITVTKRKGRQIRSASIAKLGPVKYTEKRQGWGDLSAETGSHIDSDGDRITERFEIVGVPDVARLHRLLLEAQQPR